jgi:hypothetical protein
MASWWVSERSNGGAKDRLSQRIHGPRHSKHVLDAM